MICGYHKRHKILWVNQERQVFFDNWGRIWIYFFFPDIVVPGMVRITDGKKECMFPKPTLGFEPRTPGLQNQSSTVELRWHNYSKSHVISQLLKLITLHINGRKCKKIENKIQRFNSKNRKFQGCCGLFFSFGNRYVQCRFLVNYTEKR